MNPKKQMSDIEYVARRGLVLSALDGVGTPVWQRFGSVPPWIAFPAIILSCVLFPSLWLIGPACLYVFAYIHARMRRLAPPSLPSTVRQRIDQAKQYELQSRHWEVPPEWDERPSVADDPAAGPRFGRKAVDR